MKCHIDGPFIRYGNQKYWAIFEQGKLQTPLIFLSDMEFNDLIQQREKYNKEKYDEKGNHVNG